MLDRITPLILTFNEIDNISRTLAALHWARRIVVVDSGSTDGTREIAEAHDNVVVIVRRFDSHALQWTFGLEDAGIESEWILALDADYFLPDEMVSEIAALQPKDSVSGYRAGFRYAVHGRLLSGSLYPPVTVLYRRRRARYIQDGHTQRLALQGTVEWLNNRIIHDDRKPLSRWLQSQEKYAALESERITSVPWSDCSWTKRIRRMIVIAPWLVPLYCLIVKRGLLDGLPGWHYALQRGIAEAVLSLKLIEARLGASGASADKEN